MDFDLEMPEDGIDWKSVLGLNLEQLVHPSASRSYITRTINASLPSVLYGAYHSLEEEPQDNNDKTPYVKALLLAQLNAQVLYQTHSHLQQRAESLEGSIQVAKLQLEQTHQEFTRKKLRRRRLRKQLEELQDMTDKYRLALSLLDPSTLERVEHETRQLKEVESIHFAQNLEDEGTEKWEQTANLAPSTPAKSEVKKGWDAEEEDSVLIGTIEKKQPSVVSVDSLNVQAEEAEAEDSVLTGTLER